MKRILIICSAIVVVAIIVIAIIFIAKDAPKAPAIDKPKEELGTPHTNKVSVLKDRSYYDDLLPYRMQSPDAPPEELEEFYDSRYESLQLFMKLYGDKGYSDIIVVDMLTPTLPQSYTKTSDMNPQIGLYEDSTELTNYFITTDQKPASYDSEHLVPRLRAAEVYGDAYDKEFNYIDRSKFSWIQLSENDLKELTQLDFNKRPVLFDNLGTAVYYPDEVSVEFTDDFTEFAYMLYEGDE